MNSIKALKPIRYQEIIFGKLLYRLHCKYTKLTNMVERNLHPASAISMKIVVIIVFDNFRTFMSLADIQAKIYPLE